MRIPKSCLSVCLSQIPLRMSYTLAKACLFCIPSQFVALCNPFRSGNQRHGNLVAEHELRQAATRICRATCMRIQAATRRYDQSRATCMLVCTRLYTHCFLLSIAFILSILSKSCVYFPFCRARHSCSSQSVSVASSEYWFRGCFCI